MREELRSNQGEQSQVTRLPRRFAPRNDAKIGPAIYIIT
ncbi:hypothetical protein RFEPED_0139 [Rickettsia felis str. Pedreira]|uniref:Uncharacterized protein n=1 Tax=Rickettsia felis str. Pedreira TaxID=1359196 RepID=A0A0F3MQQ1_RICFI|nr:hypothetical protein RFEPED_0139 [Rickettsia felis str. Pedreira]